MTASVRLTFLYDADCGFCARSASFIVERLAPPGAIEPQPIGSPRGDELLGDLPAERRGGSWHLVAADGRRWSAGAAIAPLLRELPRLRWLAPIVEALPAPVVEAGYRLDARNRATLSRLVGAQRCGRPEGRPPAASG